MVVWGEFGRTPKINKDGRPRPLGARQLGPALRRRDEGRPGDRLDRQAGRLRRPAGRSTTRTSWPPFYHNLGIDPHAFIRDKAGRPVSILPFTAEPIRELI